MFGLFQVQNFVILENFLFPKAILRNKFEKSLNIVDKHVFICSNSYIYTTVVQEVYNRDRFPEVDDVEDLAAAATKHLDLLKQKDKAESSFIIKKVWKLLKTQNTRSFPLYLPTARFYRMRVLLTP